MIEYYASIATLILFIIYFIGRFWSIIQSKNEIEEVLSREDSEEFKIVDEFNIGINNCENIFLTAQKTLLSVKVFECSFNSKTGKIKKGKLYCDCGRLRNNLTFKFNSYLVEGIPQYMIEYQSNDFTMGWLLFAENGKNGIVDELIYKKHTAKSVLFALFR